MRRLAIVLASSLLALAVGGACARGGDDLAIRIEEAVARGDGAVVDFAGLTDFSWDRLHVFPPYTPLSRIDAELGFRWPLAQDIAVHEREEVVLLVFLGGGKVVRWVAFPRYRGDFIGPFRPDGYPPEASRFTVRAEEGGYARWSVRPPSGVAPRTPENAR